MSPSLMARAASTGPSSGSGVVAIFVLLIPHNANSLAEAYVLLTVQPRTPSDSLSIVDLPEGMMDGDSNFAGVAAKEIKEKLGIVINQTELTYLTDKIRRARDAEMEASIDNNSKPDSAGTKNIPFATHPSSGGEHIKIFSYEKVMPSNTLHEWKDKYGFVPDDSKMIALKVVRLPELWMEDTKDALAASMLYSKKVKELGKQHAEQIVAETS